MPWDRRIEAWREGFANIPELTSRRAEAETYIERVKCQVEDRHISAHATWDTFRALAEEPTINARRIRAEPEDGLKGRIAVEDYELTVSMLKKALDEVNQLNRDLVPFTEFLNGLRPVPKGAKKV
jgi:hypothetical protein